MDNQYPCQCSAADAAGPGRPRPGDPELADFRAFPQLARLMLILGHQGFFVFRELEMEKFETLAFAVGFIATGVLTIVAQMQIV